MLRIKGQLAPAQRDWVLLEAERAISSPPPHLVGCAFKHNLGINNNEYTSLSSYYWPNPLSPDGLPYVKRDTPNPEKLLKCDRAKVEESMNSIKSLFVSYAITKDQRYAEGLTKSIRSFFIDPSTGMAPNLTHSGIVPIENGGYKKSGCIIDGLCFWPLSTFVRTIEGSPLWPDQDKTAMKRWFNSMSRWMMKSKFGKKAFNKQNNWLTSHQLQTTCYLVGANKSYEAKSLLADNFGRILSSQIDSQGSQPLELERQDPLHYTNYNLHMMSRLALVGKSLKVDMWNHTDESGCGSIYKAMRFAAEMIQEKGAISERDCEQNLSWLRIASKVYGDEVFADLAAKYEGDNSLYLDGLIV